MRSDDPPSSIRAHYEQVGAQAYYQEQGRDYRNPHEPLVQDAIIAAVKRWSPGLAHVLDLSAGSGEATLALRAAGAGLIDAVDPFTADAYRLRTGSPCERFSFSDVAAGVLAGRLYSLVVCSYALHLCEPSRLPGVAQQLSCCSDSLLIVTPHKRPVIEESWGWTLVGEQVIRRVRSRFYRVRDPLVPSPGTPGEG